MTTIIDYQVVECGDIEALQEEVLKLLQQGYQLQGTASQIASPTSSNYFYNQTLVLYEQLSAELLPTKD